MLPNHSSCQKLSLELSLEITLEISGSNYFYIKQPLLPGSVLKGSRREIWYSSRCKLSKKRINRMKCPIDSTELQMADRQGVEIDYCPQCRGVWLDRGELDKIIERSAPTTTETAVNTERSSEESPRQERRESFLADLFDFM